MLRICGDKEEWDDYVLEHGGHPLQLWGWGQVKKAHGWSVERLFVEDDEGVILGGAQVLIRPLPFPLKAFSYIPRGPLASDENFENVLETIAERMKRVHKAVVLSVEPGEGAPALPNGWVKAANNILSPQTILLDVSKSESDLLAYMAKKTRQYIRKSSAEVSISQVRSSEELEACLELYRQTGKRAGFNLHSDQYYRDIYGQLKDHSPIFIARSGSEIVAFLWLAISADTSYELYGGVNETGQTLRANYALKWHAIRKVKEWGISSYDFGGMVAGGVSIFKQGWASVETEFVGTYDKPLSKFYVIWNRGLPLAKKTAQKIRKRR